MKHALFSCVLAAAGLAAAAAPVHRCAGPTPVYSDQPCATEGRRIETRDERSEAQRLQAAHVAATDQKKAAQLQQERLQQERLRGGPALAGSFSSVATAAASAPHAHAQLTKHKRKKPFRAIEHGETAGDPFTTVVPGKRHAAGR